MKPWEITEITEHREETGRTTTIATTVNVQFKIEEKILSLDVPIVMVYVYQKVTGCEALAELNILEDEIECADETDESLKPTWNEWFTKNVNIQELLDDIRVEYA